MSTTDRGRDFSYLTTMPWKRLEMEEQAWARRLMGEGRLRMSGTGPDRRLEVVE